MGFYQADADVISEECYGDWIEPKIMDMWGTYKMLKADSYLVSA